MWKPFLLLHKPINVNLKVVYDGEIFFSRQKNDIKVQYLYNIVPTLGQPRVGKGLRIV